MKLYSNAGVTTIENIFAKSGNVYMNSTITLNLTTTGVTVLLEVYNGSDVLQSTVLNTTASFTANVGKSLKDDINAGVAPYYTTTASGKFYAKLTISKTGEVNAEYETEQFTVTPTVAANSLIEDSVDFMLYLLRGGLTDPRSTIRTNPEWITPSFPDYMTKIEYPFVVVKVTSETGDGYLGISSLMQSQTLHATLMVCTKNNLIKQQITDDIVELLRINRQAFTDIGFYNHRIVGSRDMDADESRIQRKEIEVVFDYIAS